MGKYNERLKKDVSGIEQTAMAALMAYDWPGNIRELENVFERMMLFSSGEQLTMADVPPELLSAERRAVATAIDSATASASAQGVGPLKELVKETTVRVEREVIVKALKETGGNLTRAAQMLQISRKSLQNKMKEYELRDADEGAPE